MVKASLLAPCAHDHLPFGSVQEKFSKRRLVKCRLSTRAKNYVLGVAINMDNMKASLTCWVEWRKSYPIPNTVSAVSYSANKVKLHYR